MFGGATPPRPTPPPAPPTEVDEGVQAARDDQKRRARASQGYSSTITTGPMGDTSAANTGAKQLLGQ